MGNGHMGAHSVNGQTHTTEKISFPKLRWYTCLFSVRKWKVKRPLGGAGKWEYEVGEDLSPKRPDSEGLTESIANVSLLSAIYYFVQQSFLPAVVNPSLHRHLRVSVPFVQ